MGLLILLLLIIASFLRPKSGIITALGMVFMWILFWLPQYPGDLTTYEKLYNFGSVAALEPGYGMLVKSCLILGISFSGFRIVLGTIYVGLLYRATRRLTEYTAVIMALCCLFPMSVFCSVLRSGLACVLALNGIVLLSSRKWRDMAAFVVWVLLAASVHRSSMVLLLFLCLRRKIKSYLIIVLMMCSVVFAILLNYTDIIQNFIVAIVGGAGLDHFTSSETRANFTGMVAEIIVLLSMVIYTKIACLENEKLLVSGAITQERADQAELAFNISVVWFLMLPLMVMANPFMRFVYMTFPMMIAVFSNTVYSEASCNKSICKRVGVFPVAGFLSLAITILLTLFFEAPYLAQGQSILKQLIQLSVF